MKWTEENNKLLVEVVSKCKDQSNKISWGLVQQYFPKVGKIKLKSQYTNRLKDWSTYTKWTEIEKLTKEQLRSKFQQNIKMRDIGWQMIDDVNSGKFNPNKYSIAQIKDRIGFYSIIKNRICLLEKKPIIEPTRSDIAFGLQCNDPIELLLVQSIQSKYSLSMLEETLKKLQQLMQTKIQQQQQLNE